MIINLRLQRARCAPGLEDGARDQMFRLIIAIPFLGGTVQNGVIPPAGIPLYFRERTRYRNGSICHWCSMFANSTRNHGPKRHSSRLSTTLHRYHVWQRDGYRNRHHQFQRTRNLIDVYRQCHGGRTYTVAATVSGAAAPANFSLTNNPVIPSNTYVFYMSGQEAPNASNKGVISYYALAGVVRIDSNGNVLAGEQDYNDRDGITSPDPSGDGIIQPDFAFWVLGKGS